MMIKKILLTFCLINLFVASSLGLHIRGTGWGWGVEGGYDWASYPMRHGLWLGSNGYFDGDMEPNLVLSGCEFDFYSYQSNVYPCY